MFQLVMSWAHSALAKEWTACLQPMLLLLPMVLLTIVKIITVLIIFMYDHLLQQNQPFPAEK